MRQRLEIQKVSRQVTRARPTPSTPRSLSWLRRALLSLGSALLLILAFPNGRQPVCAWVALAPWLVLLRGLTPRRAFGWSYLIGLIFFLGSLSWLTQLAAFGGAAAMFGWVVLCAYLAVYFGVFGWFVARIESHVSSLELLILLPAVWVALEYARSHFLSGLGWNLLGYSQTPMLSVIQIADVTGVWGVSFLLVMVNVAIATYVLAKQTQAVKASAFVALVCVLAAGVYGRERLQSLSAMEPVRVSIVQGNIPQDEKWEASRQSAILERYERLTAQAGSARPQLIVWPETAVPGFLGIDPAITTRLQHIAKSQAIPLLIGAPMGRVEQRRWLLTNSAALLDAHGAITARYDKLHLVPFGEFIPGDRFLPWLRDILPPIGEFVPGKEFTVFELPVAGSHSPLKFSTLICFEDIFPELARQFVRRGAQLLVTITNDAWFGKTAAAYQHAQASTFRAVELRRPMIRAANTGWSGCIDATGTWQASVHDPSGRELFVEGVAACDVRPGTITTVYARWGDWLPWLCWSVVGCWGLFRIRSTRSRR